MAIATNNSLPLVSPGGGMENVLSGAPFAAATPGGEHPPIVTDIQAVEVHDGDLSEAYFQGRKLKGEYLVDPDSGQLTDDPAPYFEQMEDYGRISDCRAPPCSAHPGCTPSTSSPRCWPASSTPRPGSAPRSPGRRRIGWSRGTRP